MKSDSGAIELKSDNREARRCWDHVGFAKEYGLKLVGANYFVVDSE